MLRRVEACELLTLIQALFGHVAHRVYTDRSGIIAATVIASSIASSVLATIVLAIASSILAIASSILAIAS
jgi:hypothetical protein